MFVCGFYAIQCNTAQRDDAYRGSVNTGDLHCYASECSIAQCASEGTQNPPILAIVGVRPPLDGLHYNIPISLEVRPYRRPRGWKHDEQRTPEKEKNPAAPILEGNESDESQQAFGCHSDLIVATEVRDTSGMQLI
jgi:hypothetical protein